MSVEGLKQLTMTEEVFLLTVFPAGPVASGRCGMIQIFMSMVRALRTLEKLLQAVNISLMMVKKGLLGIMTALLIEVIWDWLDNKDVLGLTGQEFFGAGRKLLCNQNLELISSRVEPLLVSRLVGLSVPGHQIQSSALNNTAISIILAP